MDQLTERQRAHTKQLLESETKVLAYIDDKEFTLFSEDKARQIQVFRKVPTDGTPEIFKVVSQINATPLECHQRLQDQNRVLEWDPAFKSEGVLDSWKYEDRECTFYTNNHNGAFGGLVSPRELVNIRISKEFPDGSINTIFTSVVDTVAVPATASMVRAWNYPSGILIKRLGDNLTEYTFILHIDIKGSLPFWMVRSGIVQQLVDTVAFQKKVAAEKK